MYELWPGEAEGTAIDMRADMKAAVRVFGWSAERLSVFEDALAEAGIEYELSADGEVFVPLEHEARSTELARVSSLTDYPDYCEAPTDALPPLVVVADDVVIPASERLGTAMENETDVVPVGAHFPPPSLPMVAKRSHLWMRRAAVVIVVALLASVSAWGWTQHTSATRWNDRAVRVEGELTTTKSDLAAANTSLTSTRADLSTTRTDLVATKTSLASTKDQLARVTAQLTDTTAMLASAQDQVSGLTVERDQLTAQVETLANDKARIEDESKQLTQILAVAPVVTTALRSCLVSSLNVSKLLLDVLAAWPYASLNPVTSAVSTMKTICDDATTKMNNFESTVHALGL